MAVRYKAPEKSQARQPTSGAERFAHAVTLHGAGNPAAALALYADLLQEQTQDAKVSELAGIACMQLGRHHEAITHLRRAGKAMPDNAPLLNNLGVCLKNAGELREAVSSLRQAIALRPDYPEAHAHLGVALEESGMGPEALDASLRAIRDSAGSNAVALETVRRLLRQPHLAAAFERQARAGALPEVHQIHTLIAEARANAFAGGALPWQRDLAVQAEAHAARGDAPAAAHAYERFLEVDPTNAAAWNNLGLARRAAGQRDGAVDAFRRATALDARLDYAWSNLGGTLVELDRPEEAREALVNALQLNPALAGAHANLGMLHRAEGDVHTAARNYEQALRLDPAHYAAHINLGNLRHQFGDDAGAHAAFEQAVRLRPQDAEAMYSLGITSADPVAATRHLTQALALRPDYADAEIARLFHQLRACDWHDLEARLARVESLAGDPDGPALAPFWVLATSGSRRTQLSAARKWARARMPRPATPAAAPAHGHDSVVRVGLLSGDLRDHAVGQLLADVLPRMSAGRCQLWAYDSSPEDGSRTRSVLLGACHRVQHVHTVPGHALAEQIRADRIDVLVDLAGYSQHSRSQALAWRPAPVQVSWLGYPGSMGWDAVDVLLADDHLIPASHEQDYDERIVRLPVCYQPARRFATDVAHPRRTDLGLPEHGLVFAAFANSYKLRPEMFHCWMRLLAAHPGSVLWLARYNASAEANLREQACRLGVAADRLVFAPIVDLEQHLARLALADLCLDTAPYGSGVTATQSLSAGVPLLTMVGETYVGRMAASLLHALQLPQLVASDLADYEQRALRLAGDDALRAQLRANLTTATATSPVFDAQRSARDLETTFIRLAEAGRPVHAGA